MSAKVRSRCGDFSVYVAVRIAVCVVQALSFDTACGLARWLGWLACHVDKRHPAPTVTAITTQRESVPKGFLVEAIIRVPAIGPAPQMKQ